LVQKVTIEPTEPKPGDTIVVTVSGDSGEMVPVEINFDQRVPVLNKEFSVRINKIEVPWSRNTLFIEASKVEYLKMSVKRLIWISRKIKATDGIATFTLNNISEGKYDVKLSGEALQGAEVTVKVKASSVLRLDEGGTIVYTMNPSCELDGSFAVKCNEIYNEVEIKPSKNIEPFLNSGFEARAV
jgi:hypothetical protein